MRLYNRSAGDTFWNVPRIVTMPAFLLVGAQAPPLPPQIADFLMWNEVIIPLVGMAMATILGFPIVRAVVRRIESKASRVDDREVTALRSEVAELRQRLEGLEEAGQRVAELEERVDFAERMLAQQRQARPLGSGG